MTRRYSDDMSMDEIMRLWPGTIRVVIDYRMLCVGCPFGRFHTVNDAIRAHGHVGQSFRLALLAAIERESESPPQSFPERPSASRSRR